jgi:hypothetical protein
MRERKSASNFLHSLRLHVKVSSVQHYLESSRQAFEHHEPVGVLLPMLLCVVLVAIGEVKWFT